MAAAFLQETADFFRTVHHLLYVHASKAGKRWRWPTERHPLSHIRPCDGLFDTGEEGRVYAPRVNLEFCPAENSIATKCKYTTISACCTHAGQLKTPWV